LRLSIAEKQGDKACKILEKTCTETEGDYEAVETAVGWFVEAGWERRCENVLWKKLAIGRGVAKQWVKLTHGRLSWKPVIQRIEHLPSSDLRKPAGILAVAEALAEEGKHPRMRSLLMHHAPLLRVQTRWWGDVGHHFSLIRDDRGVVEWMHDWRKRRGVESWMLLNLGLALTGLKRWEEAQEVHRFAVEQTEPDYTHPFHEAWLAFAAWLDCGETVVNDFFSKHDVENLDPNHQWIAALTQALQIARLGRNRGKALPRARQHLIDAAARIDSIERDVCFVNAYRMAVKRITEICGQEWGTPKTILPTRK
jgi:hypothetical protein